jgi:acetolactate decarboxylase
VALWVMIETPRAVLALERIAAAAGTTRLGGFVLGLNDLAKDTGMAQLPGRAGFVPVMVMAVMAARSRGLVLLDGVLRVCRGDGQVLPVAASDLIPFAEVVRFEPTHVETVSGMTEKQFETYVEELVPSDNLFYALRVDGAFEWMTVREAVRQQKPYRGLADAVKDQHENAIGATRGSMVGFKGPDVFQGLSVADFHLHYLDDARAFGGHVMDFELAEATLSIQAFSTFTLRLPEVESYLDAELDDMDADEAIRQAESS